MTDILLLNGPNLNLLGTREPEKYGNTTLEMLEKDLSIKVKSKSLQFDVFQANSEEKLINRIHQAKAEKTRFIVFNPAAFTHTSIALRDALLAVNIPFIEIHISNVFKREIFRHHSYFSDIAYGSIVGLGIEGYHLAIDAAIKYCQS